MFFPKKITGIKESDKVLEVGPGGLPHPRADVFLDLDPKHFKDSIEESRQRGLADKIKTDKPIVYYDGGKFPFKDKEFDYVICSHVVEHVPDPRSFCKELFRVAKRGYIEYPTVYYDYMYNFDVHPNLVKMAGDTLVKKKKKETSLDEWLPVQKFFFETLEAQHVQLIDPFEHYYFEGFQWEKPFKVRKAKNIKELTWDKLTIPRRSPEMTGEIPAIRTLVKRKINRALSRVMGAKNK